MPYSVGVMKVPVEERDPSFSAVVDRAASTVEQLLTQGQLDLHIALSELRGPHLAPQAGAYSPLDFLQMGFAEHLVQRYAFLLVVTEVDLSATGKPYVLALSSSLANIGIISTRRLAPGFWGEPEADEVRAERLAGLMLHVFGHLLNLPHHPDPANVMYDLETPVDLDGMTHLTPEQFAQMRQALPKETREATTTRHPVRFTARMIWQNRGSIARSVKRANPFGLVTRLPAMMAAALSVMIVLFFSPEMWDVASTVELYQLVIFAALAIVAATTVLYRAFSIGAVSTRGGALTESSVVMRAATALSLLGTVTLLYVGFWLLAFTGAVTIFPTKLMETWPTVDPAVRTKTMSSWDCSSPRWVCSADHSAGARRART